MILKDYDTICANLHDHATGLLLHLPTLRLVYVTCYWFVTTFYSVPAKNYLPTLNLQNFAELLGFIRYIYIYTLFFFEEELTWRPSCLSGNSFMVFRSFSSCNMEYNLYAFFYIFVDTRQ